MNEDKHSRETSDMNEAVMNAWRAHRWTGRSLAATALALGVLAIFAGVVIAWADAMMIQPMERLLLQDYPRDVQQSGINAEHKVPLPREELDWRHIQVTAAHGKVMFLTDAAVALLGIGTLVTLLLVIFNRRVTLRQVNASLAQISQQIRDLQSGKGSGSGTAGP